MALRVVGSDGNNTTWANTSMGMSSTFSLAFWLNIITANDYKHMLDIGTEQLWSDSDGVSVTFNQVTGPTHTTGSWYYYCYTKSGSSVDLYYGIFGASSLSSDSGTDTYTPSVFRIGTQDDYSANIAFGNVKIWDGVALTSAQADAERFAFYPINALSSLHAWYPLLQLGPSINPVYDWSGNGYTLTRSGSSGLDYADPPIPWGRSESGLYVPSPAAADLAIDVYDSISVADWAGGTLFADQAIDLFDSIGISDVADVRLDPSIAQEGFRWRDDDGDETGASWIELQDVQMTGPTGENRRLRVLLDANGNPVQIDPQLEYRVKGSGLPWRKVELEP
jgi:hypothetical protein